MPNRYVRDEIINIALDMAQLPNLKTHDAPNSVVQVDAFSVQWLQDILDFWYHMVPFSATVGSVPLNATMNNGVIVLPSDFILDVRNGYLVQSVVADTASMKRVYRMPLQKFLNRQLGAQRSTNINFPQYYCVVGDDGVEDTQYQTMIVSPVPNISTVGQLWYYKLPMPLKSNTKPRIANDYVCIEYVRIRACEWAHVYEPGTAQKFCEKVVAGMKAAGLMNEPEDDEIPFDTLEYRRGGYANGTYAWMGPQ